MRPARPLVIGHSPLVIPRRRRGGFALLITITLLAFLVLLLVSLSSLTRVETQVATNSQSLIQARQNALMALNIAIGQLQKYTGPDQRSTAAADIAAASTGGFLTDGQPAQNTTSSNAIGIANGLLPAGGNASVQQGTRWWTGVWGRAGTGYNGNVQSAYAQTPSPVLLNWLVSGNEGGGNVTVDATGLVTASPFDGTNGIAPFTPGTPVNWPGSLTPGNYDQLQIKSSTQPAVLLVGPGSAGTGAATANTLVQAPSAVDRYVVAPLVGITSTGVPGLGNATIGRYAWWVGDQGVKADYTVADPNAGADTPATDYTSRLRLMASARTGAELVTGFSNYPTADNGNATLELGRLLDMPQASLLDTTLSTNSSEVLKDTFHDFATGTYGVLTDTANGGLRQDLTYYFEQNSLPPSSGSDDIGIGANNSIIPSTYSPNWGAQGYAPKWDWLYSFYHTNPDSTQTSPALTCQYETATRVGVSPIITQFRMILFTDNSVCSSVKGMAAGTPYSLPIHCDVVFVLANPYDVAITTPAGMEITIQNSDAAGNAITINGTLYTTDGSTAPAAASFNVLQAQNASGPSMLDTARFLVPSGITITPGQTVVLSVSGAPNNLSSSGSAANPVPLVQGPPGYSTTATTGYFTASTPFIFTTPANATAQTTLWQNNTANMEITLCDSSSPTTAIYQQVQGLLYAKSGQVQSYGGNVFGCVQADFAGPAERSVNWSGTKYNFALFAYGRVYQDYNIRAGVVVPPNITELNTLWAPPPYSGGLPISSAGAASSFLFTAFANNLTPGQAVWAEDDNNIIRADGVAPNGVFFDFPRRTPGSANQLPVLSLGELEHASLTADDNNPGHTVGYQPAYAVGNSYYSPMVARASTVQSRANAYYTTTGTTRYFDLPYLLNTALWDTYFFSGIPQSTGSDTSINPRYKTYDDDSTDADLHNGNSAAHLLTKGAFNINSTSVNAWIALLGGLNGLHASTYSTANTPTNDLPTTGGTPYPRTPWQATPNTLTNSSYVSSGTGDSPASSTTSDAYAGYRRLTQTDITALANAIVERVRSRGPFVTLAQFINRSTVAASSAFNATINDADTSGNLAGSTIPMGRGFSGPLQAAVDSTSVNTFQLVGGDVVTANGGNTTTAGAYSDRVLFSGMTVSTLDYYYGGSHSYQSTVYFADGATDSAYNINSSAAPGPTGRTSTGIPGWLLQGDLLQSLGPVLSARSDTFVIRTYGEVVNPVTQQVTAKAWCEATVQRLPAYVDPTQSASAVLSPPPGSALQTLNSTNQTYGRRYQVVSFRWLAPSDI